jgi:hypothetical protein
VAPLLATLVHVVEKNAKLFFTFHNFMHIEWRSVSSYVFLGRQPSARSPPERSRAPANTKSALSRRTRTEPDVSCSGESMVTVGLLSLWFLGFGFWGGGGGGLCHCGEGRVMVGDSSYSQKEMRIVLCDGAIYFAPPFAWQAMLRLVVMLTFTCRGSV